MQELLDFSLIVIFLVWVFFALDLSVGVLFGIKVVKNQLPPKALEARAPKVSVIFAARNEEGKVAAAVESLLAQEYPDFEVIAVNDRSDDHTHELLTSFDSNPKLRVLSIQHLPAGWLGKNHALFQGARLAQGEWLLFTDADVIFEKRALLCAVDFAQHNQLDHLALLPALITKGLLEKIFTTAFGIAFYLHFRPWAAKNPKSKAHIGVGAFNLVRRGIYGKIGTHESFRLNVLDDMELGRQVKLNGGRQSAAFGHELISVAWAEGWEGVVKSLEKNGFAGFNYNLIYLLTMTFFSLLLNVLPWVAVIFCGGVARLLALGSLLAVLVVYLSLQRHHRNTLAAYLFHPIGCVLMLGIVFRSASLTLKNRGVRWRDTFYSLEDLRAAREGGL